MPEAVMTSVIPIVLIKLEKADVNQNRRVKKSSNRPIPNALKKTYNVLYRTICNGYASK
jgi:hypothetical protein